MGSEKLSDALEQDHRKIDGGIESFIAGLARGDSPMAVLTGALDELRRHIYLEEEFLFPPLAEAGMVPPLFVMRREHGEMWKTLDALSSRLASGADPASLLDICRELVAQLEAHNTKEETIIYPAADQVLAAPVGAELLARIDSARMPEQWVCQALRSGAP